LAEMFEEASSLLRE